MTPRTAKIERSTRETSVSVSLDVDGGGEFDVSTDIGFLRHMTETLARYAMFDLEMRAEGDDPHHVVEDCAIVLGRALREAIGDAPIERMATETVPMDDALVTVSVDLVDRPYCEAVLPDPLYTHFMRSFATSAGMTLHVVVLRGFDEHHVIEAAFKALGRALRAATRPRESEISTKDREVVG